MTQNIVTKLLSSNKIEHPICLESDYRTIEPIEQNGARSQSDLAELVIERFHSIATILISDFD